MARPVKYTKDHIDMVHYYINNYNMSKCNAIKKAGLNNLSLYYVILKRLGLVEKITYSSVLKDKDQSVIENIKITILNDKDGALFLTWVKQFKKVSIIEIGNIIIDLSIKCLDIQNISMESDGYVVIYKSDNSYILNKLNSMKRKEISFI